MTTVEIFVSDSDRGLPLFSRAVAGPDGGMVIVSRTPTDDGEWLEVEVMGQEEYCQAIGVPCYSSSDEALAAAEEFQASCMDAEKPEWKSGRAWAVRYCTNPRETDLRVKYQYREKQFYFL